MGRSFSLQIQTIASKQHQMFNIPGISRLHSLLLGEQKKLRQRFETSECHKGGMSATLARTERRTIDEIPRYARSRAFCTNYQQGRDLRHAGTAGGGGVVSRVMHETPV